ncbi:MAG TPA: helix-turn-helix transcriptional regulator, partial [Puia sp.]|nr:helix-turn-helix transcriptional regulator [Puia sp.]
DTEKLGYLISDKILNDREIKSLKMICNGKTYKQAAAELNVSMDTVKFHIKSIYKKTRLNSIAGLVKYAIKVGITTVT